MDASLYWQLHQLAFLLEKRSDESLKEQIGVGLAQYKVLEAISQNPLSKQNVIAKLLDQTEASVTRQIKLLDKKGMIKVVPVMGNLRARELSLTKVGEELVSQAREILDLTHSQVAGDLSYQEQRMLQDFFERMLVRARS